MTHTSEVAHRRNLIGTLLFFLVAFCGTHAATIATIKYGNSFSISIDSPSARVCVIFPESMRDPEGCAGLNLSSQSQPSSDAIIGIIRFNDNGVPAKAALAISREPDSPHTWLTRNDATVTANKFAQTVARRQRASVSSLHVDIRDESTPNMVRLSYNLDGLSDEVRPFMGHQITYLVWSSEAFYTITFETGVTTDANYVGLPRRGGRLIV